MVTEALGSKWRFEWPKACPSSYWRDRPRAVTFFFFFSLSLSLYTTLISGYMP